ncbi:hypothetical protein PHYBOEH_010104 [Phytophthora boehmeriae]|uniref:Uncharacterized protein n=1 Tax=Phytophthora boehmeriae TaxID=109152 RepID=A0A8T1VNZ9_9STRA|nr:hypothetical protein PHYBOEH_010104 [Phytophthora boehmeriae]
MSSRDDDELGGSESESEYGSEEDTGSDDESDSEEDVENGEEDKAAEEEATRLRIRTDMDDMQRMMVDMEKVKMRLQFRFAAERQETMGRLAREEKEREVLESARRKAEEEARSRRVEMGVQTDTIIDVLPQQMEIPESPHNCTQLNAVETVRSEDIVDDPPPK